MSRCRPRSSVPGVLRRSWVSGRACNLLDQESTIPTAECICIVPGVFVHSSSSQASMLVAVVGEPSTYTTIYTSVASLYKDGCCDCCRLHCTDNFITFLCLSFVGHVTSSVTWPRDHLIAHMPFAISYWWCFGTKPLSLTVSEIFNVECNAVIDMTLIRPLNKGQGHSFWFQSISYMRLPMGCQ